MASPTSLALDTSGNLYIGDDGNHRISSFTPAGEFIQAFGYDVVPGGGTGLEICTTATGCKAGTSGDGAGQPATPRGITIDVAGNVHVGERLNHRVSSFTPAGEFIRAFGYDVVPGGGTGFEVCTAVTGCKAGVAGGGAGQLNYINGIASAGSTLHVVESGNNRVGSFTLAGEFIQAFGYDVVPGGGVGFEVCTAGTTCKVGLSGDAAGQLGNGAQISADGSGRLHVADQSAHRMNEFGAVGSFVQAFGYDVVPGGATGLEVCTTATGCKTGVAGAAAGQLNAPWDAGIDGAGNRYVTEQLNYRVSEFSATGAFVQAFGYDVVPGGATGFEICTATTGCKAGVTGNGLGQFTGAAGIVADCRGAVWVLDGTISNVQRFGEPGTPLPPSCPVPAGPVPPAADKLAPSVSRFALSRKRFRVARQATPVTARESKRRRAPRGSRFRFTLSERADVRITIERALRGRRVGKRCRAPSRKLRKRRACTRYKRAGTLTRRNRAAGPNTVGFSGRIGRRALKPGRYRATIAATDPAGNRSKARRASFRIVRR